MRPYLWLLAPFLMVGCKGGTDGLYVMTVILTDDECQEDPTLGTAQQALASIMHTNAGTVVVNVGGALLPGTVDGTGLHAMVEEGYRYTGDDCDTMQELSRINLDGTWTKDQGLTGVMREFNESIVDNCEMAGDDDEESCETLYTYTAVKLTGSAEKYPADTFLFAAPPGFDGGY
jgi:hypothetical protein